MPKNFPQVFIKSITCCHIDPLFSTHYGPIEGWKRDLFTSQQLHYVYFEENWSKSCLQSEILTSMYQKSGYKAFPHHPLGKDSLKVRNLSWLV